MDVLNQNTRAIWCMEKKVSNQNQIMKALNDSIREPNQTIIQHAMDQEGKKTIKEELLAPARTYPIKEEKPTTIQDIRKTENKPISGTF